MTRFENVAFHAVKVHFSQFQKGPLQFTQKKLCTYYYAIVVKQRTNIMLPEVVCEQYVDARKKYLTRYCYGRPSTYAWEIIM